MENLAREIYITERSCMKKIRFPKKDKAQQSRAKHEQAPKVYDSRAEIPANAKVFVDVIDAPLAVPLSPSMQPAMRRDGSITPRGEELRPIAGPKEQVIRSLRNDPLAGMRARGSIDETQYNAGRALQEAFTKSLIGNIKAMDFTREAVDGGSRPEVLTDVQVLAMKYLRRAEADLGPEGWLLAVDVLRDSHPIKDAAAKRGYFKQGQIEYVGMRFRECLDTLAVTFGLANRRTLPVIPR